MTLATTSLVQALQQAADAAAAVEDGYRREAAARIKQLEQERAFAFRRLNLLREVSASMAGAEGAEIAVANGQAVLRTKLDWDSDSEARIAVLSRFATVAAAIYAERTPEQADEGPPAKVALAEFEAWYEAQHGSPFWILFEHYMRETPLVDF